MGNIHGLTGSDHVAQHIRVGPENLAEDQAPYYRWRELDPIFVEAEAISWFRATPTPANIAELEEQVDQLLTHLEEIAVLAVPKRPRTLAERPPSWDIAIAQARSRRAKRRYRARPNSEAEWEAMLEADRSEKKVVSEAMRRAGESSQRRLAA